MSMLWTPVFGKIVESSLWRESDLVVKVFITMMAKQDWDHVVRGNAYQIADWSKKTEKEVIEALKVLSSPDKKRIEPQEFEGRRIKKVPDGWLILNGEKYQKELQEAKLRSQKAAWQATDRAAEKAAREALATVVKGMTPAEMDAFVKNAKKEIKRRLKESGQAGAIAGGSAAVHQGLSRWNGDEVPPVLEKGAGV